MAKRGRPPKYKPGFERTPTQAEAALRAKGVSADAGNDMIREALDLAAASFVEELTKSKLPLEKRIQIFRNMQNWYAMRNRLLPDPNQGKQPESAAAGIEEMRRLIEEATAAAMSGNAVPRRQREEGDDDPDEDDNEGLFEGGSEGRKPGQRPQPKPGDDSAMRKMLDNARQESDAPTPRARPPKPRTEHVLQPPPEPPAAEDETGERFFTT